MRIAEIVKEALEQTEVTDMHTHLFPGEFNDLCLTGMDELLTFHYLIAETFLWLEEDYDSFFQRPKSEQADLVWKTLFVDRTPTSEAAVGVLTVLQSLNISFDHDLNVIRSRLSQMEGSDYVQAMMKRAGVSAVVMTNNPFDPQERRHYEKETPFNRDQFIPALRVDPLLNGWENARTIINEDGYQVSEELTEHTLEQTKAFLRHWVKKMDPIYVAASLPWDFPRDKNESALLEKCVLPVCEETGLSLSLMIGPKRALNPDLHLAGDGVGIFDLSYIEYLCKTYPQQKFLITMLSREGQYELTVLAQKFRNVMLFGCWWFLNTPQLITEITTMRFDQLGMKFIPQHSDCRVMEQLLYKWKHSREVIAEILVERYQTLEDKGLVIEKDTIHRDIDLMFNVNFRNFT
ncbi:hypothetical protein ATL39_0540 [Sinobaca qinghaiensis]|uniref:Glucuronate isomerase n=1 Tax=Sinobaca qinghaiensis TaxID=342944 RepID=A0A419V881_9BACL|nr:glucuronate isomerase [Sinobaca qinghaiensis]RKD76324.1 hypothetical protein ATL39_0540 [Sinobaca qinghaiensis]